MDDKFKFPNPGHEHFQLNCETAYKFATKYSSDYHHAAGVRIWALYLWAPQEINGYSLSDNHIRNNSIPDENSRIRVTQLYVSDPKLQLFFSSLIPNVWFCLGAYKYRAGGGGSHMNKLANYTIVLFAQRISITFIMTTNQLLLVPLTLH